MSVPGMWRSQTLRPQSQQGPGRPLQGASTFIPWLCVGRSRRLGSKGRVLLRQLRDGNDLGRSAWGSSQWRRPRSNVVQMGASEGSQSEPLHGPDSLGGRNRFPTTLVKIQTQNL